MTKSQRRIEHVPGQGEGRLRYFDQSASPEYWDALWSRMKQSYGRALRGHLPWQLRRVLSHIEPGAAVLEAGCGLAHFTVAMHARGFRATGVDWAPDVVAALQARFPTIDFRSGDARSTGLPAESFDLIYSPGVCEHFEDGPEEVIAECRRLLRPGGLLALTTPYFNPLRVRLARAGRFAARSTTASKTDDAEVFYQYAFTREEMTLILRRLGFEIVEFQAHGALKTLRDHVLPRNGRFPAFPGLIENALGMMLDHAPVTRAWGHAALWLARR